jgi:NADP-dependent 3-hydroxy acid dehydrogenase YdfG
VTVSQAKAQLVASIEKLTMPPGAIAHAIGFAIEQPVDVDVGEIIVRLTAQD